MSEDKNYFVIKSEKKDTDFKIKSYITEEQLENEYQQRIKEIANNINPHSGFIPKRELCKRAFEWFNKNVEFDRNVKWVNGTWQNVKYNYKGLPIWSGDKYAPIFLNKGVCQSFSRAFADICEQLGIQCRVVRAADDDVVQLKGLKHAWDEVVIDGQRYTVDLHPDFLVCLGQPRTKVVFEIHENGR
jgi:transglutaminase/protease-like cytokinesis protein 3